MFCRLKKKKKILLIFQNITLIVKNKAKSEGRRQWHYLAFKKLSALLIGITSKHHGDFFSLNWFHSFAAKNNPPGMRRRSNVSFWSHLGWDVADHIETSSRRRY